jgi:RNA polymerase sigma-70 factor (ECF subfamily)
VKPTDVPAVEQRRCIEAIVTGAALRFAALLSEDVEIRHDSGGKLPAAVHVLQGKGGMRELIERFLHHVWKRPRWELADLSGVRGVLYKDGAVVTAVSIAFDEQARARHIYILRNPDKLASLSTGAIQAAPVRLE